MILGSNRNEGAGFVPFTPDGPGAAALRMATLRTIACPVASYTKMRNLRPQRYVTYRYEYAGNFSNISPVSWFGAYHSSELPLLFGTHDEYGPGRSTPFEFAVSDAMQALWLSFARDPVSGPKVFQQGKGGYFAWPEFKQGGRDLVVFAENGKVFKPVDAGLRIDDHCD
jgi:carboxylesterase type B